MNKVQDFINLEEAIQGILQKFPNAQRIDVIYKPNTIPQTDMDNLELAYSSSDCDVINNHETGDFESYFRLQFDRFGICTWNEVTHEMSEADKLEEKAIEIFEDQRQSE